MSSYYRTMEQFLDMQQDVMQAYLGGAGPARPLDGPGVTAELPAVPVAGITMPLSVAAPVVAPPRPEPPVPVPPPAAAPPAAAPPAAAPAAAAAPGIAERLLRIVADRTPGIRRR
jgi:hypothetical protein